MKAAVWTDPDKIEVKEVPIPEIDVEEALVKVSAAGVCPTESLMRIGIPVNSTVFVTGSGPAAIAYVKLTKIMGAGKIISLVRGDFKADRMRSFGADEIIDSKKTPDYAEEVFKLTNGEGAEIVIEATGAGEIIENMPNCTKKGGKIILYGILGDDEVVTIPVKKLVTEEITIYGTVGNTKAWYPLVDLLASKKLDLSDMVTHRFTIDDIDKAFDLYRNREQSLIKAIIEF